MDMYEHRRVALQALVDSLGRGGITRIAHQIGKDASYVSRMLYPAEKSGSKRIGEDTAHLLAKAFPGFFGNGKELLVTLPAEPLRGTTKIPEPETPTPGAVPIYHAPDAVLVPVLANCASMGPGTDLLESDVIAGDLALSPHWINQYIRPQNPRELRFIHAYGDSMSPTFTDGDVLLVDTGPNARDPHSREGVYVLQADGKNYVKRVTPTFDGKLQVTSDNPSSKTVQTLNGDHHVDVVGRVVWAWNGKRL